MMNCLRFSSATVRRDLQRWMSLSSASEIAPANTVRLSKYIAQVASISRKQAERTIREGKVSIAGHVVRTSALPIGPEEFDKVTWAGKKLSTPQQAEDNGNKRPSRANATTQPTHQLWLVHKLRGELVTARDPHGRSTVFERLRRYLPKTAIAVGRLDYNTEGLLLITTDGQYSRTLELPDNHYHRVYRVRVHGRLDARKLAAIRKGSVRDSSGISYGPMRVEVETKKRTTSTNQWLLITCTEGKNRQIRKVLQSLGRKLVLSSQHHILRHRLGHSCCFLFSKRNAFDSHLLWGLPALHRDEIQNADSSRSNYSHSPPSSRSDYCTQAHKPASDWQR